MTQKKGAATQFLSCGLEHTPLELRETNLVIVQLKEGLEKFDFLHLSAVPFCTFLQNLSAKFLGRGLQMDVMEWAHW